MARLLNVRWKLLVEPPDPAIAHLLAQAYDTDRDRYKWRAIRRRRCMVARRRYLKGGAITKGGNMKKNLAILVGLCFVSAFVESADLRQQSGAVQFAIASGGSSMGFVKSVSGGTTRGEVATTLVGSDLALKKHLSNVTYEPLTLEVGMDMSAEFFDWIGMSWEQGAMRKNVSLLALDYDYNIQSGRDFVDAYISEVTIPTLAGLSRDPAIMTVKINPGSIRYGGAGGRINFGSPSNERTAWLSSNFRVEIGDLPTSRVARVESFTWKQEVAKDEVGAFREATTQGSKVEVPNLTLTISMADVVPWQVWHKSFVIDGRGSDEEELTGKIVFLSPDLTDELAEIELMHVGLISLNADGQQAEAASTFAVELYVEKMKFTYRR